MNLNIKELIEETSKEDLEEVVKSLIEYTYQLGYSQGKEDLYKYVYTLL